jgi:hypothetical protein
VAALILSSCWTDHELLTGGARSPEEMAQHALDALAAYDTSGLQSLCLTRFEHDSLLIPEMPIGKAPKELTDLNMAWVMMARGNAKGLRRALDDYGGAERTVIRVEFPKTPEVYGPFSIMRETLVTVRDPEGEEYILPIFGSTVEAQGRYKLAAYVD